MDDRYWMGIYFGAMAVTSYVVLSFGMNLVQDGVRAGVKAKYAIGMISLGEDPRNYRWDIDDARIDPIARLVAGGKRLDELSLEIEKEIDKEIGFIRTS